MKKILLLAILCLSSPLIAQNPIDLSAGEVNVKQGFDLKDIEQIPSGPEWITVKPDSSIRVINIPFPDKQNRAFLSPVKDSPRDYTYIFTFNTDRKIINPALFIKELGINWEIYLNNKKIASENYRNDRDIITRHKNSKSLIIPIPEDLLINRGTNILAAKVSGDPNNPLTGFYRIPVLIDSYKNLVPLASERITLMLIAVYLAFGLYHIMLFLFNRNEKYNLYFGIIGILFFIYIFSRTAAAYQIIPDSSVLLRIELISLFMLVPAFGFFLDSIIRKKKNPFTTIYSFFSLTLILPAFFMPQPFIFDLLSIWQTTVIIPTIYYLFFVLGKAFVQEIKKNISKGLSRAYSLYRGILFTVSGNMLTGIVIVAACMIFDIYDALYLSMGLSVVKYGFFALITGTTLILSNRFLYIHRQIESLNKELEIKISDLDNANRLITLSEEKYRILVEGTNEVIFLLDEKLVFKTVNKRSSSMLGVSPERLIGKEFIQFLYTSEEDRSVQQQYIHEKINELKEKGMPVLFKILYRSPLTLESSELQVRLERLSITGSEEILGKITRITEDSLQPYFISEKVSYAIGNQLTSAEEASYRLTRNLNRYMDSKEVSLVRIALREMIINAIEHGNLEITFEEKSQALESDSYFILVADRQKNPDYSIRRVALDYRITHEKAEYRVTDNGKGFNYKKIDERFQESHENMLSHGRGIVMARSVFDSITWNNTGNQVLLVKNFKA